MPIYEYQCVDCGGRDQRVAGCDDHTALCVHCGGLMLRLDEDVFQPYFDGSQSSLRSNWWPRLPIHFDYPKTFLIFIIVEPAKRRLLALD